MSRAQLPPPEPPHDPRSILLNERIGFRLGPPPALSPMGVVVDPERRALVLPLLAATARSLAEPTGSLGGVRPPSNVAIAPDGSVFALDRSRLVLKRFDACECRFVDVPALGGEGAEARQLRNAAAIAVACGNVYIADTGGDTAELAGQNHRVSVFSLKGFALRGHLVPPATERPWKPVAVTVDSLGRAWVADARGRIHRFTPAGRWERAWALAPAPAHLAIDRRDRLYVVSLGIPASLRVFDREFAPLGVPPTTPGDVRSAFLHLPFQVDADGNVWFEGPCAGLVFDRDGNRIELAASVRPIYETTATYRSEALDSRIAECVWHRVVLCGTMPAGTRVHVRARAGDEKLTAVELDAAGPFRDCAIADSVSDDCEWDCLVRAEPGRYLWLELTLEGDGTATPAIGAIVVEFPRVSLRRYLPAVFGAEPVSADFTDRFLALFDTPFRSIERQVDRMAYLFDPASAPASTKDPRQVDFLSWLGTWIGVAADRNWDIATRRRFFKRAGSLFDRRGTLTGLRESLLLLLDFDRHAPCALEPRVTTRCVPPPLNCAPDPPPPCRETPPLVLEHFRLRRWLRLGSGRLGDNAVVWGERIAGRTRLGANGQAGVTRLDASPDPSRDPFLVYANQFSVFVPARCGAVERTRKALENLMKAEAPAGTRGYLHFVEPRFRIGVQSMLGFDAVVGAVPQGVTLGSTPLGAASILTAPPHMEGGPEIAVGKKGRIGTTMRLA